MTANIDLHLVGPVLAELAARTERAGIEAVAASHSPTLTPHQAREVRSGAMTLAMSWCVLVGRPVTDRLAVEADWQQAAVDDGLLDPTLGSGATAA